ncbi:LysM peptidoglycan-binding domain-containing protein [Ornithinimicrobium sp. Y1847]|uniref:LysM peptidoglycan-binding domain-containing protein n=1 Tax=Ornithinimicrobium sp. Y1847 TaxID=3405419 RepID=UPI003B66B6EC
MGFLDRIKDALRGSGAGADGSDDADRSSDVDSGSEDFPRTTSDGRYRTTSDGRYRTTSDGRYRTTSDGRYRSTSDGRYRTTTVFPGETLADVAQRCGVDEDALIEVNGIERPDLVYAGQVFKLPDA